MVYQTFQPMSITKDMLIKVFPLENDHMIVKKCQGCINDFIQYTTVVSDGVFILKLFIMSTVLTLNLRNNYDLHHLLTLQLTAFRTLKK